MLRRLHLRPDWQIALAITLLLRVFYSTFAAFAAIAQHPQASLVRSNAFAQTLPSSSGLHYALLGIWGRFDTLWYLRIAARGYDLPASVVFYPLYPALIRFVSYLVEPVAAALLVSTIASFFYFLGLLRLARREAPDVLPLRVLALAAVWPASFFLFAAYTEALAMALIVWSIAQARDENWLSAAFCALAAGLTRSAGTLLIVPLLVIAFGAWLRVSSRAVSRTPPRPESPARRPPSNIARWSVFLAPLGTLAYWLWLRETGRPRIASAYRLYWDTQVAAPWTTLWQAILALFHRFQPLLAISFAALILFFIAGVLARRRMEDRCFSLAVILHLLLRVCSPPLFGAPRYLLPIYPAYLTFGRWANKMSRARFIFLCMALFACNLGWLWAFLNWSLVL